MRLADEFTKREYMRWRLGNAPDDEADSTYREPGQDAQYQRSHHASRE
jgi:hypothetical protein